MARASDDLALIVADDLNAKSAAWGSSTEDPRGEALGRFAAAWGLWPENVGTAPTFEIGDRSSVIDVTFARLPMGSFFRGWKVRNNVFSDSDHYYIQYLLSAATPLNQRVQLHGWRRRKMDAVKLEARLRSDARRVTEQVAAMDSRDPSPEEAAGALIEYLTSVSDETMPKGGGPVPRRSVFWWSEEIALLRTTCIASRRAYQRASRRGHPSGHLKDVFRTQKRELRTAIKKAQERAWQQLVN